MLIFFLAFATATTTVDAWEQSSWSRTVYYHSTFEANAAGDGLVRITAVNHYQLFFIGGGRNRATYGKLDYVRDLPLLGEIRLIDFLKRVRDDIQNDVFRYGFNHTFGPFGQWFSLIGKIGVSPVKSTYYITFQKIGVTCCLFNKIAHKILYH